MDIEGRGRQVEDFSLTESENNLVDDFLSSHEALAAKTEVETDQLETFDSLEKLWADLND
ncbi:hypothetical protein [Levilactobacillus fuyuanensis]|uniref:Uncharacterized protein n=1 Tax=Levilactobacillus fuyuanensis TaxID=2486022 RepID=A0ABW4H3I5_9LACO|nr:hypothetical protein [Levilactobacillus fuyuanensis]